MPRAAIALVVATLCGCSSPVTVLEEGLEITIEPEAFLLHNRDFGVPLHYAIVETRASALIDLAPCETWSTMVQPRSFALVPFDEVIGYDDDAESAWVWWCAVDDGEPIAGGSAEVDFP